jgi:hypothetical protein
MKAHPQQRDRELWQHEGVVTAVGSGFSKLDVFDIELRRGVVITTD